MLYSNHNLAQLHLGQRRNAIPMQTGSILAVTHTLPAAALPGCCPCTMNTLCMQVYDEPTVLVAKRVTGEEEVPEGAVAVLTPDAPDVLSHVSVRARNMKVLFAICHEEGTLKEVEDKEGTTISLQVSTTSLLGRS